MNYLPMDIPRVLPFWHDHPWLVWAWFGHARTVVLEEYPLEDSSFSNIKLVLGAFGCTLAVVSHYYPTPFPDNIPLLVACVILYFIASSILQYRASYIQKDIILIASPKNSGRSIRLHSNLELKDGETNAIYQLSFYDNTIKKAKNPVKLEKSAVEYFDSNGKFYPNIFKRDIKKALAEHQKNEKSS